MAIASKGTRRITVDGGQYNWKLSGPRRSPHLVIFKGGGNGSKVVVNFQIGDHTNFEITPCVVRKKVLHALLVGWNPDGREDVKWFELVEVVEGTIDGVEDGRLKVSGKESVSYSMNGIPENWILGKIGKRIRISKSEKVEEI